MRRRKRRFAKSAGPIPRALRFARIVAALTLTIAVARTVHRASAADACGKDFSVTSGTLFASHKLPLRMYLAAIAIFVNEVKGKSALALSRDLGISYKSAFVLFHKLREAMAGELKDRMIGGDGKTAEVDGGYFGGYVKPANLKENRRDRRLVKNQTGKRQCVVIVRERGGNSVPAVFKSESHAANFIKARVTKGTTAERRRSRRLGRPAQQFRNGPHQPRRGI